jgi:exodeoxyribonuclease VII large subunit
VNVRRRSARRDAADDLRIDDGSDTRHESREEEPLTVSELLAILGGTLAEAFPDILVCGEITNFKAAASGHCYLTLSDDEASVDAVMWRNDVRRLTFEPRVGDEVLCRGRMGVYARGGRMQLYVHALRPVGAGAAQRALEELKRRLTAEGLFDPDRKRALPYLPGTIGVVTSRSGAALHDVLTTLRRRFAACRVVLSSAVVQGAEAPASIAAALGALARFGECDVVIVGRGGGAAEDLAAFNDERVVRAVAEFPVPVVSAVGHEVDFTLCDLAADRRAATPTAAAELVVPVREDLLDELSTLASRLHAAAARTVKNKRHRIGDVSGRLRDPRLLVASARQRADEAAVRLERALVQTGARSAARWRLARERLLETGRAYCADLLRRIEALDQRAAQSFAQRRDGEKSRLMALGATLDALSPLAVLDRGYGLVSRVGAGFVRSAEEISVGDLLDLRFRRGRAQARVTATEKGGSADR